MVISERLQKTRAWRFLSMEGAVKSRCHFWEKKIASVVFPHALRVFVSTSENSNSKIPDSVFLKIGPTVQDEQASIQNSFRFSIFSSRLPASGKLISN